MFFGIDTTFALLAIAQGAEANSAEFHQQLDRTNYAAIEAAWTAVAEAGIDLDTVKTLAVIDFTKPSYLNRLEIHRSDRCRPERFLCAHGKNSGGLFAEDFSNRVGSYQTSLGLYRVGESYGGDFGKSLKLDGLESGVNDQARRRKIVLHSAWYVSDVIIAQNLAEGLGPRIGRSQGCPAVPENQLEAVCQQLQPGTLLFIFGENE
ncbi:MAG: hypothetical protein ACI8UO_004226 [Verrucomicrobiales bacterium]|jgi:hypothetical protein